MSDTKSTDKRFERIIVLMKKKFEQHKYYEGEQMLKTLSQRMINQNKYEQASKLLAEGALILMGHKKTKESVEITSDLINLWKEHPSDRMLNTQRAKLLHDLFCMLPPNDKQSINDFMRLILEWVNEMKEKLASDTSMERHKQQKLMKQLDVDMMPLYQSYGVLLWNAKEYYKASTAFVRVGSVNKMVDMFAEWSQTSPSQERPFYITRIVLQYLCVGNVQQCRQFIQSVCPRDDLRGPSCRHPLENFSDLLCESIERKSVVLYNVVVKTYQPLLQIDPKFMVLLQRVGNHCLGMPLPRNSGGLFGNLLSMLS
eukprot:CAMPEP_0202690798 /NCGR_PEP_ID=MMETSP1385-20130828/5692_1 /ASSEMBLY_ACC=CAM_ASM_000861 /TAXON_ID=933848 /ORGANISM="Elphidium margaritaceum" /LENGTH=312 /DNA_ID=CAMNT_0049346103 /DNA_START=24 /DNA_END=962 /DNA_ORIENTATION=-